MEVAVEDDGGAGEFAEQFDQFRFEPVGRRHQDDAAQLLRSHGAPQQADPVAVALEPVVPGCVAELLRVGVQCMFHIRDRVGEIIDAEESDLAAALHLGRRFHGERRASGAADDAGAAAAVEHALAF